MLNVPAVPRLALLGATLLAMCAPVQAQSVSQEPPYGLSGSIGLGVATKPTYEGSPNRHTVAGPYLNLRYRTREWGTVEFGERGLAWDAFEAGPFRLSLLAQFEPGRKTSDPSTLDPSPGDKRLAGMGRVRDSTEAGVGIGLGPVMLVARQALGDSNGNRAQVDLTVRHAWSLSGRLSLSVALGATWANQAYMQTYFGVTAAQARATSFSAYMPKSGLRKLDANVGAEYAMTSKWKLQAHVGLSRLADEAAASPIVSRRDGALFGLVVSLGF